ncbi:MAG TPA: DnaA/Hda family protein [Sphingomicrobium sp.]|nr:DnaA/Hda family protein [Sphingomicrobium sp.]
MKPPADQIALPLDWPQARDDSRFILSEANREAYEHFRAWSLWPVKASILTGPPRSGRSLLARAFIERVHGRLFDRAERHNEADIFHAWNAAQDDGRPLVMVVDQPPPQWEVALPDLRTRLAVTPVVHLQQPDDALFQSLIRLLFADRGLHIPEDALTFISQRVERTYWMAERVVEAIDRFAIAERARLTLPTIRRALADGGILEARGAA